ncbi:MAG TPA: serine hydrolase [Bacteroidales bacterium]|nr:serine hydrolase [Bacteroidales bacterium]
MKKTILLLLYFFASSALTAQVNKKQLEEIDKTVTKAFTAFQPAGLAIAIVKDNEIIYKKALGNSNVEKKKPLSTASLFNIASCTKAFTAASVAILVDEGKIRWTDKVTDYFPEFRLSDDYITREITVEDLLCHRSGLGTFYGDLLWYNTVYSDDDVMRQVRYEPVTRRFGIQYGYQNIMFLVAGRIIEKVTGQTWSEFVQDRFFNPLGMAQTRPSNDELTSQDIAEGHIDNKVIPMYDFNAAKAAAGIYSSVDELSLWTMLMLEKGAFRGKRIISESSVERMMSPHTIIGTSASQQKHGINFYTYGMGWFISDYNGRKIVEHDGGMPGYISKVTLVPSMKISIIILNNGTDMFVNNAIKGDLLDILAPGLDFEWISEYRSIADINKAAEKAESQARLESRISGTSPSHSPEAYTGTYNDKSYGDASIKLDGGNLILTFIPAAKVFTGKLEHWHYDTFKVDFRDEFLTYGLVTFSFDETGRTTGFKIDLPSSDFHFWNLDFRKK